MLPNAYMIIVPDWTRLDVRPVTCDIRSHLEICVTDEEFISIEPWPIPELVGQLVAQAALGRRALIETDEASDAFERETDRFELEAWARLELSPWLTPEEFRYLETTVGNLREDTLALCEQRLMVASTIGWALGLTGLPHLPAISDGSSEIAVLEWAPTPWSPVRGVMKGVRLRSDEALATERERWDILYWRSTLFGDPDYLESDRSAWREALVEILAADLWPVRDDDLLVNDDMTYGQAAEADPLSLQDAAEIRLRALNWVCGYGERPTTAPLDLDEIAPTESR